MSLRRPASGRRVGAGMLRVDAVRAIAKLRDYQLSEPTAWVLEGIRAAVASGATSVELQGDSNDVWLSWQGEPWPGETLPALLDELVSPASAHEGQRLRLLGTAVNSALGLRPSYIDVFRIAAGKAERVRFMPSLLDEQEDDATELARPTLEAAAVPKRAGEAAMFIHFRRRFGIEPIRNLFQGQPPEMRIARACCGDLPIPILIGSDEIGAHRNESDLLRIPVGSDIDGFLALLDPRHSHASGHAMMHIAEQGVHIASYALDLEKSDLKGSPPIRLFINAERMPTNASRSEVRRSAHPISAAEKKLPDLYAALCEAIVSELGSDAATSHERRVALRHSTLTLLAAFIAGHGWPHRARFLRRPFQMLTSLPLLRNALGEARSLRESWDESMVFVDKAALAADMRPWFDQVLWLADDDPAALVAPKIDASSALRSRLRVARKALKARKRFEGHAAREPRFARVPAVWVRAPLGAHIEKSSAPPSPHAYEGEVYLWPRGRTATITLLLHGREIEEVDLGLSPLAFRAIVSAPLLTPTSNYQSVLRNSHYKIVAGYVMSAAVRCVEALCQDGAEHFSVARAPSANELRALVLGAVETIYMLGLGIDNRSPLASYAAWELAGGGFASLVDLRAHKAVGVVPRLELLRNAPPDRPTVILTRDRHACLRALLEPETTLVDYALGTVFYDAVSAIAMARSLGAEEPGAAAIAIDEGQCRGAIAWGVPAGSLRISHRAKALASYPLPASLSGATIALDSDAVVPNAQWTVMRDDAGLARRDFSKWQTTLLRAFAMALIGRPPNEFFMDVADPLDTGAGKTFLSLLLRADDIAELLGETHEALRAAPIFTLLGGNLVSADDLAAAFPNHIEYLPKRPTLSIDIDDWQPLVASRDVATFAAKLVNREVRSGVLRLKHRIAEGVRQVQLATHREKPLVSQHTLLLRCPSVVAFQSAIASGLVGINPISIPTQVDMFLLLEGRHFFHSQTRSPLPIVAALEIHPDHLDATFGAVQPAILETLASEILALAPALLEERLKLESTALATDSTLQYFCGQWLEGGDVQDTEVQKIRDLVYFYDQRGQPLALVDAMGGAFLRLSSYQAQPWTEAREGEARDEWDAPVLIISEDAMLALIPILSALCDDVVFHDVSDCLRTLQIARRIAQGLLLVPSVPVDTTLKRSLTDLIGSEKIGEIGFRDGVQSQVRIFDQGEEKARRTLDLLPAVLVAIEDVSLLDESNDRARPENLKQRVASLTRQLARSVLVADVELPQWLRLQFLRGLCEGKLSPEQFPELTPLNLFHTTQGAWVSWDDLSAQAREFGTVWHVPEGELRQPMDPLRIAVTLPQGIRSGLRNLLPFVAAEVDLALDEISRQNQQRPPIDSLALSPAQTVAAITTMEISDAAGLRGIVAPLLPHAHGERGVHAHRDLKFVGTASDPCTWPTLAIVSDPGIHPNRTWRAPVQDERWQSIADEIIKVSDHALVKAMPPPAGMLTSHWVGRSVESREPEYRKRGICIRGRLWLTESSAAGSIKIKYKGGEAVHSARVVLARTLRFPLPIHGELLCHPPLGHRQEEVVQEIVDIVYPRLLRQAAKLKHASADSQAAHLALGLAAEYTTSDIVEKITFPCFSPKALCADEFVALARGDAPIAMSDSDAASLASRSPVFLRDESELSAALERLFAGRLFEITTPIAKILVETATAKPVGRPDVETLNQTLVDAPIEAPVETPIEAPLKKPVHVLDSLADDLDRGLGQLDLHTVFAKVTIATNRSQPILAYELGNLVLAGQSRALLALQAQRIAGDPCHESCLDLLVAHALTLLNHGRTSVTDSAEEHALISLLRGKPPVA